MPELPEVEVLVRHLARCLPGKTIRKVEVLDRCSLRHTPPANFARTLIHARFESVRRRGKYLVFTLCKRDGPQLLIAHLGMTGRMYLATRNSAPARHATILIGLGGETLVFEDVRRFGGMTLDSSCVDSLGPEPLTRTFTATRLQQAMAPSRQPIKVRLLDQSVVAGIGNIYASEALFRARIHPGTVSRRLNPAACKRLHESIRRILREAIRFGSTLPLHFGNSEASNGLFYYGQNTAELGTYEERLRVYGREGEPCIRCGQAIQRTVQAGRSTFFCAKCQRKR